MGCSKDLSGSGKDRIKGFSFICCQRLVCVTRVRLQIKTLHSSKMLGY